MKPHESNATITPKDLESIQKLIKLVELINNRLLIYIYEKNCKLTHLKYSFKKQNIQHLTGVLYKGTLHSGSIFYKHIKSKKARLSDFSLRPDGTSRQKLAVLPQIENIITQNIKIGDAHILFEKYNVEASIGNRSFALLLDEDTRETNGQHIYIPKSFINTSKNQKVTNSYTPIVIFSPSDSRHNFMSVYYLNQHTKKHTIEEIITYMDSINKKNQ